MIEPDLIMRTSRMTIFERLECLILYGDGMTIDELGGYYNRHRCTIDCLIRRTKKIVRRGHSLRKRGTRLFRYNWERELNG